MKQKTVNKEKVLSFFRRIKYQLNFFDGTYDSLVESNKGIRDVVNEALKELEKPEQTEEQIIAKREHRIRKNKMWRENEKEKRRASK